MAFTSCHCMHRRLLDVKTKRIRNPLVECGFFFLCDSKTMGLMNPFIVIIISFSYKFHIIFVINKWREIEFHRKPKTFNLSVEWERTLTISMTFAARCVCDTKFTAWSKTHSACVRCYVSRILVSPVSVSPWTKHSQLNRAQWLREKCCKVSSLRHHTSTNHQICWKISEGI